MNSMTIPKEEVMQDYARFIRHEAMRANCMQEDIIKIIKNEINTNKS